MSECTGDCRHPKHERSSACLSGRFDRLVRCSTELGLACPMVTTTSRSKPCDVRDDTQWSLPSRNESDVSIYFSRHRFEMGAEQRFRLHRSCGTQSFLGGWPPVPVRHVGSGMLSIKCFPSCAHRFRKPFSVPKFLRLVMHEGSSITR